MLKRGVAWRRWKRRLSRYWNSGKSLSEYCREHDLNVKTASKWRLRFQAEHPEMDEALEIVQLESAMLQELASSGSSLAESSGDSGIRISRGNFRISLASDFDAAALCKLLKVLEEK